MHTNSSGNNVFLTMILLHNNSLQVLKLIKFMESFLLFFYFRDINDGAISETVDGSRMKPGTSVTLEANGTEATPAYADLYDENLDCWCVHCSDCCERQCKKCKKCCCCCCCGPVLSCLTCKF